MKSVWNKAARKLSKPSHAHVYACDGPPPPPNYYLFAVLQSSCILMIFLLCTADGVEYQVFGYLIVDVWDHDTLNQDDFLGQAMVPLRDISLSSPKEEWYPLMRRSCKEKVSGSIRLELQLKVEKNKVRSVSVSLIGTWAHCHSLLLMLIFFKHLSFFMKPSLKTC